MSKPAAQILLERYWEECSNQGKVELVRELCADPIVRHDPNGETQLSHDEQIQRLKLGRDMGVLIERVITHANEEWATSVWNIASVNGDESRAMCGIEVFKVEHGVLAHCWNTPYAPGQWTTFEG